MAAIVGIDAEVLFVKKSLVDAGTTGGVATTSLGSGGTGYVTDETFTISTGDPLATGIVLTHSTGVVLTYSITYSGGDYAVAAGVATVASISGTGLTIDIDSIDQLVLPIYDIATEVWTLPVNSADYSWVVFPERNEFAISISVDIAEHKVFRGSPSGAWVDKKRLYMDWSGSMSGYLDNEDDAIFTNMKAGFDLWALFVDSKTDAIATGDNAPTSYWLGLIILGSIDRTTGNEDFASLDVDFEGSGELYRSELPYEPVPDGA